MFDAKMLLLVELKQSNASPHSVGWQTEVCPRKSSDSTCHLSL